MSIEIGPLRTFVRVAELGHVTRAAASLGLTQPAVSGHLARLEEAVGQSLFDRTSRGMVLTEAGRVWLVHVTAALSRLDEGKRALDELSGLARGRLAVGGGATAATYLLPPLLERFHKKHPGIQLLLREQGSRAVMDAVGAGALDLGVVTTPDGEAPDGLTVTPWVDDELLLVVPPGHRLHGRDVFRWRELDGEPIVAFEAGTAVRALIDGALASRGVVVDVVVEVRAIESIQRMVALGMGVGFVSRHAVAGGLRAEEGGLARQLALVQRSDLAPSAAARAFLGLVRDAG